MSTDNKQIVHEINKSFMEGDPEKFLSLCDENVRWEIVGERSITGKAAIRDFMSSVKDCPPPTFSVLDIIAEGDIVMCHGDMEMKGLEDEVQDYAYCDVYHFDQTKVIDLRSYIVLKKKGE
jgi:uncharacterized protein